MATRSDAKSRRHFSMLRDYQLADLITLANGASGAAAIFLSISSLIDRQPWRIYAALALLVLAFLFDILDGRVARSRQKSSPFGQELDSLADIVSFGVAPAVLAHALGIDGALDEVILTFFVACGISRLARYNVTAAQLSDSSGKVKYFEGTPIPSSLLLVALLGICFHLGRSGDRLPLGVIEIAALKWHPISALFFINGCTMISKTLHIPKL